MHCLPFGRQVSLLCPRPCWSLCPGQLRRGFLPDLATRDLQVLLRALGCPQDAQPWLLGTSLLAVSLPQLLGRCALLGLEHLRPARWPSCPSRGWGGPDSGCQPSEAAQLASALIRAQPDLESPRGRGLVPTGLERQTFRTPCTLNTEAPRITPPSLPVEYTPAPVQTAHTWTRGRGTREAARTHTATRRPRVPT